MVSIIRTVICILPKITLRGQCQQGSHLQIMKLRLKEVKSLTWDKQIVSRDVNINLPVCQFPILQTWIRMCQTVIKSPPFQWNQNRTKLFYTANVATPPLLKYTPEQLKTKTVGLSWIPSVHRFSHSQTKNGNTTQQKTKAATILNCHDAGGQGTSGSRAHDPKQTTMKLKLLQGILKSKHVLSEASFVLKACSQHLRYRLL